MRSWLPALLLGCVWAGTAAAQPSDFGEDYSPPDDIFSAQPSAWGRDDAISGLADEPLDLHVFTSRDVWAEKAKHDATLDARFAGCGGSVPGVLRFACEGAGADCDGSLREQVKEFRRRNGSLHPEIDLPTWPPTRGRSAEAIYIDFPESTTVRRGPDFGPAFKEPPPHKLELLPGFFR